MSKLSIVALATTMICAMCVEPAEAAKRKAKEDKSADEAKRVEVFFIGNSITFEAWMEKPQETAPPAFACRALAKAMSDKSIRCHNMGVSETTTTDWLPTTNTFLRTTLDSAAKVAPNAEALVFSLCLGTNDSADDGTNIPAKSAEAYAANMKAIADTLIRLFPESRVVVNAPMWYSANTYNGARYLQSGQRRLRTYCNVIEDIVLSFRQDKNENVYLGDTTAWSTFAHRTDLFIPEAGQAGVFHLHPNISGAEILGNLWAKGLARAVRAATPKHETLKSGAEIMVYPAASGRAEKAVIVCPGGGYHHLAKRHEGTMAAEWLSERGVTAIVLFYTMPQGQSDVPMRDAREAIEYARAHAAELGGYTEVGIMGSSAGGHLASTVATHTDLVDFQILLYPVISMDPSLTHRGSHDNLLGANATKEVETLFSNDKQTSTKTPRAFIALSMDDKAVPPVTNGMAYAASLSRAGVPTTLLCYPSGGHGWGFRTTVEHWREWRRELERFLSK